MKQKNGMCLVYDSKRTDQGERGLRLHGLAGWLLEALRSRRHQHTAQRRMQLIETLPLGGKRQVMLIRCEEEMFLVGGSLEGIETIVPLQASGLQAIAKEVDETCS